MARLPAGRKAAVCVCGGGGGGGGGRPRAGRAACGDGAMGAPLWVGGVRTAVGQSVTLQWHTRCGRSLGRQGEEARRSKAGRAGGGQAVAGTVQAGEEPRYSRALCSGGTGTRGCQRGQKCKWEAPQLAGRQTEGQRRHRGWAAEGRRRVCTCGCAGGQPRVHSRHEKNAGPRWEKQACGRQQESRGRPNQRGKYNGEVRSWVGGRRGGPGCGRVSDWL